MIDYHKTIDGVVTKIDSFKDGCWINCIEPQEDEINMLIDTFGIDPDLFRASLDKEESSHIDVTDKVALIVIDIPEVKKSDNNITYSTMPLSIMIMDKCVITVSIKENPILEEFSEGIIKNIETNFKTNFVLNVMLRATSKYLQYLNQIDKISHHIENELRRTMRNKELLQFLEIEKSLVYFSTSLKSNSLTLQRIMRGKYIKLYEEDQDLMDDLIIEVKQALEMSDIYLNILSSTMETFSSVISNNLNVVMKVLASITLIMSIPTIISGFYGMNGEGLFMQESNIFPLILSIILMIIAWYILKKKDML